MTTEAVATMRMSKYGINHIVFYKNGSPTIYRGRVLDIRWRDDWNTFEYLIQNLPENYVPGTKLDQEWRCENQIIK